MFITLDLTPEELFVLKALVVTATEQTPVSMENAVRAVRSFPEHYTSLAKTLNDASIDNIDVITSLLLKD